MKIALVVIFFNRPALLRCSLPRLSAWPHDVVLVSDGPRQSVAEDVSNVAECREYAEHVFEGRDVIKEYSSVNLGCRLRIQSALDSVFEKYDAVVVIEDDCVVSDEFLNFLINGLTNPDRPRNVAAISGFNMYPVANSDSFLSDWFGIWGWATWREKWIAAKKYRVNSLSRPTIWSLVRRLGLAYGIYFWRNLRQVELNRKRSWDYEWCCGAVMDGGLCMYPGGNMVRNIGGGVDATHTAGVATEVPLVPSGNLLSYQKNGRYRGERVKAIYGRKLGGL